MIAEPRFLLIDKDILLDTTLYHVMITSYKYRAYPDAKPQKHVCMKHSIPVGGSTTNSLKNATLRANVDPLTMQETQARIITPER